MDITWQGVAAIIGTLIILAGFLIQVYRIKRDSEIDGWEPDINKLESSLKSKQREVREELINRIINNETKLEVLSSQVEEVKKNIDELKRDFKKSNYSDSNDVNMKRLDQKFEQLTDLVKDYMNK